jgi:hypothetical protein
MIARMRTPMNVRATTGATQPGPGEGGVEGFLFVSISGKKINKEKKKKDALQPSKA